MNSFNKTRSMTIVALIGAAILSLNLSAMRTSRQPGQGLQKSQFVRDAEVRGIIFAMDNGTIKLLLGHDPKTKKWNVFAAPKRLAMSWETIRDNQTNSAFHTADVQEKEIDTSLRIPDDQGTHDIYYVTFYRELPISIGLLNTAGINKFRDLFAYVSLDAVVKGTSGLPISQSLVKHLTKYQKTIKDALLASLQFAQRLAPAPMIPAHPTMIPQPQPVRDVRQQINGAVSMIEESGFGDQFAGSDEGFRILEKLATHGNNELVKEALLKLLTNKDQNIFWPAKRLFEKLYGQTNPTYTYDLTRQIMPPQMIQETIVEPVQLEQPKIATIQPAKIENAKELQQTVEKVFNQISSIDDRIKRATNLHKLQKNFVKVLFSICWQLLSDLGEERFNTFDPAKQKLVIGAAQRIIPGIENIDKALIPVTEPKSINTFADYVINNWLPMQQPLLSNAALNQTIQAARTALTYYQEVIQKPDADSLEQMKQKQSAEASLMDSIEKVLKSIKKLYQEHKIWR